MSETWNNENLPENHILVKNRAFVAMTEGTWNRKKNDGTTETAPKWDYVTEPDENGSLQVGVFSSTDKEAIELNKQYDLILKKAVGKDGTFFGYSLKGFGPTGEPIIKKEPQSRFQKGQKLNARAEAIKASAQVHQGTKILPDELIEYAEILQAFIEGNYPQKTASGSEKPDTKAKK